MRLDPSMTTPGGHSRARAAAPIVLALVALVALGGLAWWLYQAENARNAEADAAQRRAVARGRQFLQEGRPDEAIAAAATVPPTSPKAAEALTIQGLAHAARGDTERTRALLERSIALDPAQPMALKVLAAVAFDDNEPDRGLDLLARAAALDPDDFRPWYAAGAAMVRLGDRSPDAVKVFREALKRAPGHGPSRLGLAEALVGAGDLDESGPLVDGLLRESPSDPRVLRLAARRARLSGDVADTLRLATAALGHDPGDVEALVIRGQALLRSGDAAAALADARSAAETSPRDTASLALGVQAAGSLGLKGEAAGWADRLRRQREAVEAVARLREAVDAAPDEPGPRCRLGDAAAEAGLTTLARRSYRAALELDPDSPAAKAGLRALDGPGP